MATAPARSRLSRAATDLPFENAKRLVSDARRSARRLGWKAEDGLDDGLRLARRNPGKTAVIAVVGVLAMVGLAALARRR